MSDNTAHQPNLTDQQLNHILSIMKSNKPFAYSILKEEEADIIWGEISTHPIFSQIANGSLLKSCWEETVDSIYCKQVDGKGDELNIIEMKIMAVMVEEPILESTIDLTKSTINTTKRSATDALTTPVPPKMKKIEFQKAGLTHMGEGNMVMEECFENLIRWSNFYNKTLSVRFGQINSNLERLNKLLALLPKHEQTKALNH